MLDIDTAELREIDALISKEQKSLEHQNSHA